MTNPKIDHLLSKYTKELNFSHLKKMTTKNGLIQHAINDSPDFRFGYSIDDNARGIIAIIEHDELFDTDYFSRYGKIYLQYIFEARKQDGSYHNFADIDNNFIDNVGSLDSQGRVVFALAKVSVARVVPSELQVKARSQLSTFRFYQAPALRSCSFATLGYLQANMFELARPLSRQILKAYKQHRTEEWKWFENSLTYSNAIIPLALLQAGIAFSDSKMIECAQESFLWLHANCHNDKFFAPIGNHGWYYKENSKALFDQQVVDVADMVMFSCSAYKYFKQDKWLLIALEWMSWFFGNNKLGKNMVTKNGGVYDGLTEQGVNLNQGAESMIMYFIAYLSLSKIALTNK